MPAASSASFEKKVRSFLFEYRKVLLTNNVEKAIKETFGYEIGQFDREFQRYLRKRYYPVLLEKNTTLSLSCEMPDSSSSSGSLASGRALSPLASIM